MIILKSAYVFFLWFLAPLRATRSELCKHQVLTCKVFRKWFIKFAD